MARLPEAEAETDAAKKRPFAINVVKVLLLLAVIAYIVWGIRALVKKRALDVKAQVVCRSHLIELWQGLQMYALDCGNRLPPADAWCDAIAPPGYPPTKATFHCPAVSPETPCDYAMNIEFGGADFGLIKNPHSQVLLYDSTDGRWDAADALTSLPHPPRHPSGNNYAMADGAIKWSKKVPPGPVGNSPAPSD
jgi:prepilin-type processing-associated H-X9-DG protein